MQNGKSSRGPNALIVMERYRLVQELGDGTYGSVSLAIKIDCGQKTAIKKMKKEYRSWEEAMSLKELKALKKLHHPNIVRLHEVIREKNNLYFVFEYMEMNLYELINSRKDFFPEPAVRNIVYQILQGLSFIHRNGFFHRDLKPENILCCGPELVKIADFGLAREIRSKPPFTDYVSTRWYRAPEILLRSGNYSCPIDIWAVGCVTAELYTFDPIFPGVSEIDQMFKICSVLGTPTNWAEGQKMAARQNFKFPRLKKVDISTVVRNASPEGVEFLDTVLRWDPKTRPTAQNSLRLPYFLLGMKSPKTQHSFISNSLNLTKIQISGKGDAQENLNFTQTCSKNGDAPAKSSRRDPFSKKSASTPEPNPQNDLLPHLPRMNAKLHYLSKARYVSGKTTNLHREEIRKENKCIKNTLSEKTTFPSVTVKPLMPVRTNWAAKYLH